MPPLYWSRSGEVACGEHAPAEGSVRWEVEGWRSVTPADADHGVGRCQQCGGRPDPVTLPHGRPLAILNVDDRPASLYVRERILQANGFAVTNADSAATALGITGDMRPDVILMDVHLGDADGRELCRRLKADPRLTGIPVVLISATLSGQADMMDSFHWGEADAFLHEPVDADVLISTIRHAIREHGGD